MSSSSDSPSTPPSPNTTTSTRRIIYKVYGVANKVQAITAVSFTTFAVMHGLQIATGAFFGVEDADQTLLLTRPIYQDAHLEGVIVTGSLVWHVVAGMAKSTIQYCLNMNDDNNNNNNNSKNNSSNDKKQLGVLPYHDLTGQLLVPLAAGHYYLARGMPLKTMGDSAFVDFGIIAWGLQNRRVITWGWHAALIGVGVYHMVGGAQLAFSRTFRRGRRKGAAAEQKQKEQQSTTTGAGDEGGLLKSVTITHGLVVGISTVLLMGLVATSRVGKIPMRREYQEIYSHLLPGWII
ncbi:hypothetical protein BCR42DRAFT_403143 [Absidia repens]|uniref:Mitochondrial adapter protein MCP1 transmembrane domain-containing protein n=1 Tax=Absidia repens TaxID=90262 RepID=A0A1X2IZ07_9FUNG|nr:hypothetical protein BCR42DRAFT_403143 [Absidia repens]